MSGASLQVVSACTRRAGLLPQYEKQLADAGIPFHLEHITEMPNNVGNLGLKVDFLRRIADKFSSAGKIVLSDAWDVLFYGTAEDVLRKIPDYGVLLAAERNCWPDDYLAPHFPGETPWRFVNGGLMAGSPESISLWCDEVETHPAYIPKMIDQQWLNHRRVQRDPVVPLDDKASLFYCMIHDQAELGFDNGIPVNTLTNERPSFIHFNGKTDPTMFFLKQAISKGFR